MVKKFCYFLRYYNILFHLLLGIGFCIISSPLSDLLCYLQKIPDESLFHTIYKIIIPIDLYIRDIINMLKNNTTDTDLIVYRGIQDNVFNEVLKSLIEEASIFPDCDLYDKGILATSLVKGKELRGSRSPQKTNKFKGFRILVPKGSHVKYMGNVNFEEHYYEVDIQHGAKLQVISADKEYINCLLVSTN